MSAVQQRLRRRPMIISAVGAIATLAGVAMMTIARTDVMVIVAEAAFAVTCCAAAVAITDVVHRGRTSPAESAAGPARVSALSAVRWRCTPRALVWLLQGVLALSQLGQVVSGSFTGLMIGGVVGWNAARRVVPRAAIVAVCTVTGGTLGWFGLWSNVLVYGIGGGAALMCMVFVLSGGGGALLGVLLAARWLLRALGLLPLDVHRHGEVLSRMSVLLPRHEAVLWLHSNLGYLADIADPRERRAFLRSLTVHFAGLLWVSWSIQLRRRRRIRRLRAVSIHPETADVLAVVVALAPGEFRALMRGTPVTVRTAAGRTHTVRCDPREHHGEELRP